MRTDVIKYLFYLKNSIQLKEALLLKLIDRIILHRYNRNQGFFFIQIGANDGISGDPIHKFIIKYNWSGILVEPVIGLFSRLKENYAGQNNLIFENLAISETEETKLFYRIKESNDPGNPSWYDQIGSFLPEVVLKHEHQIPNFKNRLITDIVPCLSYHGLLCKHGVKKVDLLHIDTEGYDYQIIKMIDIKDVRPDLILFEYKHLNKTDLVACEALLKSRGYKLLKTQSDILAF
mgnify:CR=1 FL=1